jgi:hypothetical protein
MPVIRFAKDNARPGDIYVLPPKLKKLYKFRLETGIPILVNWKTHPYKDTEVIEWYDRIETASTFYESVGQPECCGLIDEIADRYHATHIIVESEVDLSAVCPHVTEMYHDAHYRVFRIQ